MQILVKAFHTILTSPGIGLRQRINCYWFFARSVHRTARSSMHGGFWNAPRCSAACSPPFSFPSQTSATFASLTSSKRATASP